MSDDREREKEAEGSGFTVRDRRTFSQGDEGAQGAAGSAAGGAPRGPQAPSTGQQDAAERAADAAADGAGAGAKLPDIDLKTFVMSLGTSALYHLGVIPDPDSDAPRVDLPLAKQTIDILSMLEAKTEGNRTDEETHVLQNLLYELRIRYVDATKK